MLIPEQIPEELKQHEHFVLWKYVEQDGKKKKVPYTINQKYASVTNPKSWTSWEKAIKCTWADGVGFVFTDSPYVGIDIDHCLDGGEEEKEALGIAQDLGTYCEISPSGTGLHMIGKAELSQGFRTSKIEVYPDKRYFTLTGNVWQGLKDIKHIQEPLERITGGIAKERNQRPQRKPQRKPQPEAPRTAAEVVALIRKSTKAGLFSELYDMGDVTRYGNKSSADMALINMLAFWTGRNEALMEEIFKGSALAQRDKAQNREDYVKRTIAEAVAKCNNTYDPNYAKHQAPVLIPTGVVSGQGLLKFAFTDAGNAERMKELYFQDMRYYPAKNRWILWNGKQWEDGQDTNSLQIYGKVVAMARKTFGEVEEKIKPTTKDEIMDKAKKLKFCRDTENITRTKACIQHSMGLFEIRNDSLDQDPYILNCQNGTLDLRTGELRPHSREDMITKICRANFNPEAHSPLWEQTLQTILPDVEVRAWLKRFVGYSLFGLTSEEKFVFLYGKGGGGKGTFTDSIGHMLGDYAGTMDIDTILASRNDAGNGGQPTPQIAGLAGKRFIVASESGAGRKFNTAKLKNITGSDPLTGRHLYQNPFTFNPQFTLFLSSNYKPDISDPRDEGMRRRLVIVPFDTKIAKKDIMLKNKLRTQEAMEGILAWCVEGAKEWWQNQGVGELPEALQKVLRQYFQDNDTIGQFVAKCCEETKGGKVPKSERCYLKNIHRVFCDWAGDDDMKPKAFVEQMRNIGYDTDKDNKGTFFKTLTLVQIPH